MTANLNAPFGALRHLNRLILQWFARAWRTLQFAAHLLSLAFSREPYLPANRNAIAKQLVTGAGINFVGFTVFGALVSVVLIRIVVVTALSYGLSKFALGLVVRVLVLELIPLSVAVFVALRCTLPDGVELAEMRGRGEIDAMQRAGIDPVCREGLPRVVAGILSVLTLVAVSCVMSLVLAYLAIYGFSPWGFSAYTRVVGQVFSPAVSMILVMKTLFFSFAVSLIPISAALYDPMKIGLQGRSKAARELASMVRLFFVVLIIEVLSLLVNYY